MARRSALVRFVALFVALALAGSQAALASFAPPASLPAMQERMAEMSDCHEADAAATQLCRKTCQDEPQKPEVPSLAALPPSDEGFLRVPLASPARGAALRLQPLPARATSPPPLILFAHYLK